MQENSAKTAPPPADRIDATLPPSVRKRLAEKKVRLERTTSRDPALLRSRWIAAPLSALLWASCVVIVIAWTPLVFLYRFLTFPWDRDRYRVGRLFHDSAAFAAKINPFWKFRIHDEVHPDDRRPYVFVANHSSFTDVFLLASLPWEMKFLSKKSIFQIPLLGWQMTIAGDVPIVRGDRENVQAAMRQLRDRLDRRLSVIFFPEGTRSPDGSLGEFREGAFRLAIEAGVEVLPLAIYGASSSLPKHSLVFQPTTATVMVLTPEPTEGLTAADAPGLAARVRERIAEAIRKVERSEAPASS
jgi:1-acyl-sn-glycerol-3-phosphate acyltransferase